MTLILPTPVHDAFKADFTEVLRKHQDAIDAPQMLAAAAQFTGMILALQDQQTMDIARAYKIIEANLTIGNQSVVEGLMQSEGRA